jgi:hypothetical protein
MVQKVDEVFAHGIRGALIPRGVGESLFGCQDFNKAAGEMVELVGLGNVPVQRGGVELSQQINPPQTGIDAIGDGNVHQAVFAGQRHSRFGPVARQRRVPCPPPMIIDSTLLVSADMRAPLVIGNPFLRIVVLLLYPADPIVRK